MFSEKRSNLKKAAALLFAIIMIVAIIPTAEVGIKAYAVTGNEVVAYARQFIGYPYVWGTQGPNSFDCSGFVHYVFKHFGMNMPAGSSYYWNNPTAYGTVIDYGSTSKAQAGDIISWSGHVAIYTENGMCVEALNPKYGVCERFKVDSHTNGLNYKVIRPNFSGSSITIPTDCRISTNSTSIYVGDTVTFTYNIKGATEKSLGIDYAGGERYATVSVASDSGTVSYKFTKVGTYCCIIEGSNSAGYNCSHGVYVTVNDPKKPAKPQISTINVMGINGKVIFSWSSAKNATCYNLFIYSATDLKNPIQSHWAIRKNSLTAILPNGRYYARLCSENETNTGNFYTDGDLSECFTVDNTPEKPYFADIYVDNNTRNVTFKWKAFKNSTCYNMFIYSTTDLKTPVQQHWAIRKNEIKVRLPDGEYVARLCSENETEVGNYYTDGNLSKKFVVSKSTHIHSYTLKSTSYPTCTEIGKKTYACSCGASYTETISALGHSYATAAVKATLAKDGSTVTQCTTCGDIKTKSLIPRVSSVYLTNTVFTYSGNILRPSVIVKDRTGKTLKNGTDYTVKYSSDCKNVGQHSVTITLKGKYAGTKPLTYRIIPKGTSISKLTAGKKQFTAKWSAQTAQTTGYELQYSTSSSMSGAKTVTVGKNKATSSKVKKIKGKKKYYVRIRTYKTVKIGGKSVKLYSAWSKVKSVKTK